MSAFRKVFSKIYYLGFIAAAALAWHSYNTAKSSSDSLRNTFANQENVRALLQLNVMLQRTHAAISTAISLNDINLLASAQNDFKSVIDHFDNAPLIDPEATIIILPRLKSLNKKITVIHEAFQQDLLPSKADVKIVFNTIESARGELTQLEAQEWESFLKNQGRLIKSQNKENLISSIAQLFLSVMLIFLITSHIKKDRAEKIVRASESLHKLLFASLAEGVILCLKNGLITYCNDSAGKLLGADPQRLTGKKFQDIYPLLMQEDGGFFESNNHPILSAANSDMPMKDVTLGLDREGRKTRWLSMNSQPVFDPEISESLSVVISLSDITKRIEDKQTIVEQQMHMASISKMSALGEMAGGVAHEINNPLAIIHAQADELKELTDEGEELTTDDVVAASNTIQKTVDRISRIVKGLRTFAREGSSDPFTDTPVKELIQDSVEIAKAKLKDMEIDLQVPDIPEDLDVSCRATQIEQVIMNLISNSADAISHQPKKWIRIEVSDMGESVSIAVVDSGLGVPKDVQDKIFQPFFTTKKVGKGTGLGMSISKGIVDAHKGQLYINNNSPNTCFVIELPKERMDQKAA